MISLGEYDNNAHIQYRIRWYVLQMKIWYDIEPHFVIIQNVALFIIPNESGKCLYRHEDIY